jgi:hypothetical protein
MMRTYENGDVYDGENQDGSREGVGTCKYADGRSETHSRLATSDNERLLDPLTVVCMGAGSVYEGEWLSDRMDGYGTLRLANTDMYQGKARSHYD